MAITGRATAEAEPGTRVIAPVSGTPATGAEATAVEMEGAPEGVILVAGMEAVEILEVLAAATLALGSLALLLAVAGQLLARLDRWLDRR